MKYFVFGDIHSFFNEWIEALQEAGFDPLNEDHAIISLGDLLDRGPNAQMCLDFVNNLPDSRKILIKGNHEDLMIDAINRGYFKSHDLFNGTEDTVRQVTGLEDSDSLKAMKDNESWNKYYNSCIDYYELDDNIFVHGWIPYAVDVFLPICDSESGDLRSLPFPGSLMEQPYMTMQIILTVQGEYKACLSKMRDQIRPKTGSGGVNRRPVHRRR